MTELTRPELAKLYREFSRQKYNKYRHQFPRMRESELVSKIIKEWEALTPKEKQGLFETYMLEKHISQDKSESSERISPGSSKPKKQIGLSDDPTSREKKPEKKTPAKKEGVRVYVRSTSSKKDKAQSESSDFARDGAKKDFEISESDSKEIGTKAGGKRKRITKTDSTQPKTEYLKFFKFYYEKLSKEHPRWTANQISTIIKLLWKKKQNTDKSNAKALLRAPKERRRVSGRMAFRRSFNYTSIEGFERWKQLPIETKKYWRRRGEGLKSGERRIMSSHVHFDKISRKSSQSSITVAGKALGFLSKSMAA